MTADADQVWEKILANAKLGLPVWGTGTSLADSFLRTQSFATSLVPVTLPECGESSTIGPLTKLSKVSSASVEASASSCFEGLSGCSALFLLK